MPVPSLMDWMRKRKNVLANSKGHAKSENIRRRIHESSVTKRLCILALIAFWLSGCWSAVKYEAKSTAPEACLVSAVGESGTVTRRGDLLKITTTDESVALVQVTDDGKFNVVDDPKNSQELTFRTQVRTWLARANETCARKWERKTAKRVDPISLPKSEVGQPSHGASKSDGGSCDTLKRCLHTLAETTCRDNPECGFDIRANPFRREHP